MNITPSYIFNSTTEVKPSTLNMEIKIPKEPSELFPLTREKFMDDSLKIQTIKRVMGEDPKFLNLQAYSEKWSEKDWKTEKNICWVKFDDMLFKELCKSIRKSYVGHVS